MSRDDSNDVDDIYDFDYLNADNSPWDQVRPKAKPKVVQDKRVKLPPVLVGRNIAAETGAARMAIIMANRRNYTGARDDAEKDWHKERMKLKGPRQPQKEVYGDKYLSLNRSQGLDKVKLPDIPQRIPKYKEILAEGRGTPYHGVTDETFVTYRCEPKAVDNGTSTTIDGQSQYIDRRYRQRNGEVGLNVDGHYETAEDKTRKALLSNHASVNITERDRSHPSVFDKDYLTKEEKAAAAKIDLDKELEEMASINNPKPPSTPKPVDNSRARRRVRYRDNVEEIQSNLHEDMERKFGLDKPPKRDIPNRTPIPPLSDSPKPQRRRSVKFVNNTELNHAVSVHNDPKPYYKARPNTPFCIDYDTEVKEAVIAQRRFQEINLAIKRNQANGLNTDDLESTFDDILKSPEGFPSDARPMTAALMSKNETGCSTTTVPNLPLLPHLKAETMVQWNGEVTKKGVGFKSKLIKEEPKKVDIIPRLPEKIRKQMERYFN